MSIKNEKYYEELLMNIDILKLNDKQSHNVIEIKKIGSGGFGKVIGGNYFNLPIAIKKMKNFNYEAFYKEINMIRLFRHPFIPRFYFINGHPVSLNMVQELIKGRNLDDYIKKIKPTDIQIVVHMLDLAIVLNHLHNYNMIHRDLKPSNIMIDDKLDVKLLDFGISKITQNRSFTTTLAIGTILYMAPENFDTDFLSGQTMNDTSSSKITGRVDVWAFGCMLSEIFSKSKPWTPLAKDDTSVISHLYCKSKFPIPEKIDRSKYGKLVTLIERCTLLNECERYNFYMVIRSLRDLLLDLILERMNTFNDEHKYLNAQSSKPKLNKSIHFYVKYRNI